MLKLLIKQLLCLKWIFIFNRPRKAQESNLVMDLRAKKCSPQIKAKEPRDPIVACKNFCVKDHELYIIIRQKGTVPFLSTIAARRCSQKSGQFPRWLYTTR
jgi:hypothetical protein